MPPDKLSKKQLTTISMVLEDIKYQSKNRLTSNKETVIYIEKKLGNRIKNLYIPDDMQLVAEQGHLEALYYLVSQGAIKEVVANRKEKYDYAVTLVSDNFSKFYDKVMILTIPYLESILRQVNSGDSKNSNVAGDDNIQNQSFAIPKPNTGLTSTVKAQVKLIDNEVTIFIAGLGSIVIKKISRNGAPANFLYYLEANQNKMLGLATIQTSVKKCSKKDNLTELARQCGFDKKLKKLFFSRCEEKRITYSQTTDMPMSYAEALVKKYSKS